MSTLSPNQIEDIAQTVAMLSDCIEGFYQNPNNEKAFQDWYFKKYGHYEKEPSYE